ncbi:MAG: type transport system permease protein [Chthoniobacter sp.]|jgi:ABC-2 type transport system permease protein|nr:type transport system permease protein [Chthoniobacter sp.]
MDPFPVHPPLSTLRLFRLLLWVHWRSSCARWRIMRKEAPLLIFVLGGFIISYLGVGYWLFHAGLGYLYHFPLVGSLLSQRILYLIFAFFFVMLVFSNLIIGYSTLFKNRETSWLLSLPIPHRNIYRWKFLEALVVSSWALIFLSAPMMAAYGGVHDVPLLFYFQITLVYLPFVVLPAVAGSWIIVFLVRILARSGVKKIALVLALAILLLLVFGLKPVSDADAAVSQDVLSFDQLLRHTRLSVNPFLPSAWLAQSVLSLGEGLTRQGAFFFLLLLSNALMGLLVGFEIVGRFFYGSWTLALSSRAERFQRAAEAKRRRGRRRTWLELAVDRLRPFSQPAAALVLKDVRLFWRDPAQWIQFMIFFGLLCIYVLNLRNVAFNFQNPFWETMISYLNLAASALTLSTLTTRFVFPQFSLEGRRLWIIGLAPFGLEKVLLQKFWLSCLTAMSITTTLMIVSSVMLHLEPGKVFFFALAIALMSASLSGLAVGLGALFPNFKEDNPSKIVSGFGGTLCLVVSFMYITLFVALAALPDLRRVVKIDLPLPDAAAFALAASLSLCVLFIPLVAAARRVKNLEI